jgi:hypothetical protein
MYVVRFEISAAETVKNAIFWDIKTSHETHYFSATESSQLMLCKILSFYGGDCEECHLLVYKTSQETITSPL